jgi:hypothetical protein
VRPSGFELHEPFVRDAREYVRLAKQSSGKVPRGVAFDYIWGDPPAEWGGCPCCTHREPGNQRHRSVTSTTAGTTTTVRQPETRLIMDAPRTQVH